MSETQNDIVVRLRRWADATSPSIQEVCTEAADEIDRLREQVKMLRASEKELARRLGDVAPWKAEDVEPMVVRLFCEDHEYELWYCCDDGVTLIATPSASIYWAETPRSAQSVPWIDDEERDRRIAAGADPDKVSPPVSESPYAREFRAMRNRWLALKKLFVVE